jgi:type IV pilus assembly protein PilC
LQTGTIEADNDAAAAIRLKQLGYFPIEIQAQRVSQNPFAFLSRAASARELSLFARQMGTLIAAGVGLGESLTLVSAQMKNARLKAALQDVRLRVEQGETLSEALSGHRRLFPTLLLSIIQAGEAGGMLAEVLERAADHYESIEELKGKVTGALVYPAFLVLVGTISVAVLVTFVVPRFADLFAGLGQALPLPTQILMAVSGFMASYYHLVVLGAVLLVFGFIQATRQGPGRMMLDKFKLEMPLYGSLIVKLEIARFARTLAALLENGVSMLSSLNVVANTLGNRKIAAEVRQVRESVEQGSGLGEALSKHTGFTDMAFSMVRVGESSGATPEMLERIAIIYQREVDRAARALTTLLEPVLIIIMGGVVTFIVMSILLPVFRLEVMVK